MKIAVVGCGAVGSYYGARLALSGHEVHFLLRSDYEAVRRKGVVIHSVKGDFEARPACARDPKEIGPCDLVLIALKTTANHEFSRLLPPLVDQRTALLTLQNGLGNEESLADLFPVSQIMGGLCFVCLNRIAPGVIEHLDHGLVVIGEYLRSPEARTRDIAGSFDSAGVPCKVTDNLERAHWEKLTWNIPFNGLGVAAVAGIDACERGQVDPSSSFGPCLTTDLLLADQRWESLLRNLMLEVVAVAQTLSFEVPEAIVETQIERTRTMGRYKASTLIDFERGLPMELDSLFIEPLRRARKAGAAAPLLANLCAVLGYLARKRD